MMSVEVTEHTPEQAEAFKEKLAYWRANGGLKVNYPYGGRQAFKDRAIESENRKTEADAKAAGIEVRKVPSKRTWVA